MVPRALGRNGRFEYSDESYNHDLLGLLGLELTDGLEAKVNRHHGICAATLRCAGHDRPTHQSK